MRFDRLRHYDFVTRPRPANGRLASDCALQPLTLFIVGCLVVASRLRIRGRQPLSFVDEASYFRIDGSYVD
jgi:hypothetical protein